MITKSTNLRVNAKNGLANWLNNKEWNLWTTLSTGYELTLPGTRRAMIRFHDKVSKTNPCQVFWAAEKFDVKDGFHLHTLWKFQNEIHNRETYCQFVNDWRTICKTNSANVYSKTYKMEMGAHKYISKYITKQITDYDYFDTNSMNKETINNNTQKFNEIGRNISAKRKIEKLCKKYGVEYQDVKKDYYEELKENKIWYEDISKIEKQIYSNSKTIIYGK
jgi:hypothetical protein